MHGQVAAFVHQYGYIGVFLIMFLEVAGIPSIAETALLACGIELALGVFSYVPLLTVAVAGNVLGGLVAYLIGQRLGRPILVRYGRYIGLNDVRIREAEQLFAKWGLLVIIIGKWVAGAQVLVPYLAGINRMRISLFCIYNVVGTFIWVWLFLLFGRYLGKLWKHYGWVIHHPYFGFSCACVLILIVFYAGMRRRLV